MQLSVLTVLRSAKSLQVKGCTAEMCVALKNSSGQTECLKNAYRVF